MDVTTPYSCVSKLLLMLLLMYDRTGTTTFTPPFKLIVESFLTSKCPIWVQSADDFHQKMHYSEVTDNRRPQFSAQRFAGLGKDWLDRHHPKAHLAGKDTRRGGGGVAEREKGGELLAKS